MHLISSPLSSGDYTAKIPFFCRREESYNAMQSRKSLLVLFIFLGIQVAVSVDTLQLGEALNSTSQLVSADGIFTLGFYTRTTAVFQSSQLLNENSYLAIWYTNDSFYPVWMANRANPSPNNSTPPVLTLGAGGELLITHHGGGGGGGGQPPFVVYGGGSRPRNVTATLLNTGNFVVKSTDDEELVWQSFDHPTDTLLPGMKIGLNSSLSSWFEESNPIPGAFTLEWDPSVRKLLIRRRGVVYWSGGENFDVGNSNYFSPMITSRWRLNYKGILNGTVEIIADADECYGYNTNDGCQLRDVPTCRFHNETFQLRLGDFRRINKEPMFGASVYDRNSSLSLSDCRDVCWEDCRCIGFMNEDEICEYWMTEKDMVFEQNAEGSNYIRRYILVSSPSSSSKGKKNHIQIIIGVVGSVLLITLGIALFILRKIKRGKREEELHNLLTLEGYTDTLENGIAKNHDLKLFMYASIVTATTNFSSDNKLGQGGFGPVYKGRTAEGQDIAVKVLSRQSGQGLLEFKTELVLISKLQHVNLVKLQGFCIHGDDKMIIYDYVHNKSLDFFLFSGQSEREKLDWNKRFNIIEGTAQGLLYLHKYSRLKIIHRDLKPSNILLDQNMNPKISDFGLARIFKKNANEANTERHVGTYGYMAPEYAMQGLFSVKSDVYSFGVMVLEIVSGRKNSSFHEIEGPLSVVEYAWELWRKDCAVELMDPALKDSCIVGQLQRCIQIGLLCVENHAVDRPTVEDVVSMLKNETTALPMPKNPEFITRNSELQLAEKSFPPEKLSANEATISEMQGR